jgi:oxygen-dependent protoporphyrinogen oxidase
VPLPRTATLGIPADPFADDALRVLGADGARRAARDLDLAPTPVPASLARWVTERLGPAALDRLVAPVAGGIHSADPAVLDPRAVAPQLVAAYERTGSLLRAVAEVVGPTTDSAGRVSKPGSAVAGIDGGLHRLVDALVRAIETAGGEVRARTAASTLTYEADRWTVATRASSGDADVAHGNVTSRRVVIAAPRSAALDLLAPWLRGERETGGSDVRLITLALDAPALDVAPRGTGVLAAPSADVRAKGLTHSSAKWPWLRALLPGGVHVVRLSYGRAGASEPTAAPTVDEAVDDASRLLGVTLSPEQVIDHVDTHWPDALAPARQDDRAAVPAALAATSGLTVVGGWIAGTGLAAVVGQARAAGNRAITP